MQLLKTCLREDEDSLSVVNVAWELSGLSTEVLKRLTAVCVMSYRREFNWRCCATQVWLRNTRVLTRSIKVILKMNNCVVNNLVYDKYCKGHVSHFTAL